MRRSKQSDMTEVRVAVNTEYLENIEEKLGLSKSTDVARVALSLLDWAADEAKQGRLILSTDKEGENAHRLVIPELSRIAKAG